MKMPIPVASFSTSNGDSSVASAIKDSDDWQPHIHRTAWPFNERNEGSNHGTGEDKAPSPQELVKDDRAEAIQKMKAAQRSLLPAVELQEYSLQEPSRKTLSPIPDVAEIERPRSALHSGDFRETQATRSRFEDRSLQEPEQSSPPRSWYNQSFIFELQQHRCSSAGRESPARPRAPSLGSLSSSFVFRPPTSPLVQQSNNPELDISEDEFSGLGALLDKSNRRRTLPPESFRSFDSPSSSQSHHNFARPMPHIRKEYSLPYQAHQPRRSISSMHSYHTTSNSQTPLTRSRRQSLSSDVSPLHASMVGSYEESILRGRMSTTPSRPLDFLAKIGVLGKGKCKPKLRFPSHVTVSFPAVFYSYPELTGRRSVADDNPSPYVGSIDLEHNLKPPPRPRKTRKSPVRTGRDGNVDMQDVLDPENDLVIQERERRKRGKKARRSRSPPMPLGGCYRLPQEGQLQVVITNPNNTAVKLFLIPYTLEGMEPGTKTFIRQRSYSTGPVVEPSISGTFSKGLPKTDSKPILRYLIHLMICCPSRGRFYLYDTIRVVFANRVPDGKEKLRNEVHFPEPKYTPFKPARDTLSSSGGAKLATDLARRRSSVYSMSSCYDRYSDGHSKTLIADEASPQEPIPFSLPTRTHPHNDEVHSLDWGVVKPPSPEPHWPGLVVKSQTLEVDSMAISPPIPIRQIGADQTSSSSGSQINKLEDFSGDRWRRRQRLQQLGRENGRNTPENVPSGYSNENSSLLGRKLRGLDADANIAKDSWYGLGSQEMQ